MRFDWMTQVCILIDDVVITTTLFYTLKDTGGFQFGYQAKRRALCNSNSIGNIAQSRMRIVCQANQYVRIIAQEHPALDGSGHIWFPRASLFTKP